MTYNETPQAQEAKALLKRHLQLPDGVAQQHVDTLDQRDLADLVASNDYPFNDRPGVLRSVLSRAARALAPDPLPPPVAAEPAPDEQAKRPRRTKPE